MLVNSSEGAQPQYILDILGLSDGIVFPALFYVRFFMSCYHPVVAQYCVDYSTGEAKYKYNSHKSGFLANKELGEIPIPCGKCIGCRLDYSRQWADRMMIELDHSKSAVFVTLTYDNDHLSRVNGSLVLNDIGLYPSLSKRDLQLFMKRLRSRVQFIKKEIRFYAAGEYGPSTHRPHYHLILFGLSLDDFKDRVVQGYNHLLQPFYSSNLLSDIWQNGFVSLAPCSWETFAYVSRYVQKKAFKEDDYALLKGLQPEFALMSRDPGLGGYFYKDHMLNGEFEFNYFDKFSREPSVKNIRLPKYLEKKIELIDPVLYNERKEKRIKFAEDARLLELQGTDLDIVTYFEQKEQAKLRSSKLLLRKEL